MKKGICLNFGECKTADNKTTVQVGVTEDFVCPECGSDLKELPPPKKPPIGLFAAVGAAVAALGFGAYMFLKPAPETTVEITQRSPSIEVDGSVTLKLKTTPEKAANKLKWKWESDDEDVAVVDRNGRVRGIGEGYARITVTAEKDETITEYVDVKVTEAEEQPEKPTEDPKKEDPKKETEKTTEPVKPKEDEKPKEPEQPKEVSVTGVTLNNRELKLSVNCTYTLVATIQPSNATNKKIEWSSNNTNIVTVDANGNITAKTAGRAVISATSAGNSNAVARCTVVVQ